MSYILDALKKAERDHHQAKVPTLETVHGTSWAPPRHLWLGIGAAVALANVAVLIWLLVPGPMPSIDRSADSTVTPAAAPPAAVSAPSAPPAERAGPASPAEKPPAVAATAPAAPAPASSEAPASRRPPPEQKSETTTKRGEAKSGASVALAPAAPTVEPGKPRAVEPPAPPDAPAAPEKPAASTPAPPIPPVAVAPDKPAAPPAAVSPPKPAERGTRSLPLLRDMTPADQEAITKMTLQFLVYSDVPGERLVFINNQKYIEGQMIDGKVLVEGILPDGAVLSYQGKRFILRQ